MWMRAILSVAITLSLIPGGFAFVNVTRLDCEFNEKLCKEPICIKMRRKFEHTTYISLGCFMPKPVDNANVRVTLYRKYANKFERYFLDMDENVCELLRANINHAVFKHIFQMVLPHISHIHCPFVGNVTVIKMPIQLNLAAGIFREKQYKVGFQVHRGSENVFALNLTFAVVKD